MIDNRPTDEKYTVTGQICQSPDSGNQFYRMQPGPFKYLPWAELPIPIDELVKFYFENKT
jgi:hypothetical protein